MTEEEALILWPKIQVFAKTIGHSPDLNSTDPLERRMAEAIVYLKAKRREHGI